MATTIVTFEQEILAADFTTPYSVAEKEVTFVPPPAISGKLCYLECTVFTWDANTPHVDLAGALLYTSWPQVETRFIKNGKTYLNSPVAICFGMATKGYFSQPAKFLIQMPDGSHTVRFKIQGYAGSDAQTELTGDESAGNRFFAMFQIVPAASRPAPLP